MHSTTPPLPAEAPVATNPADGLQGLMVRLEPIMMRGLRIRFSRGDGAAGARHRRCPGVQVARAQLDSVAGGPGPGPGAFTIQAQMPDVDNIEPNSRVRVADVTVGNVTKIERQGWHALVTMELNGDVQLPANATAKLGQTSLLVHCIFSWRLRRTLRRRAGCTKAH